MDALPTSCETRGQSGLNGRWSELLQGLRWHRLVVEMQNVRNQFAREHPLHVFKGIFKYSARAAGISGTDYFFHPVHAPLPERIGKGQNYQLSVAFPQASLEVVDRFMTALEEQLQKQPRNFALLPMRRREERSLARLQEESDLDLAAPELCLDFLTPLPFSPEDAERPWMLSVEKLVDLCAVHLARIFPSFTLPTTPSPSLAVKTLPYFWQPARITHDSKSQPPRADGKRHRQTTTGWLGPLYLRGAWQQLLPLLHICSELHLGHGRGDYTALAAQTAMNHPIASFVGAYRLKTGRSYFDRELKNTSRYRMAANELEEESDAAEELATSLDGGTELILAARDAIAAGTWAPQPAQRFRIPKKDGTSRDLYLLAAEGQIVHRTLHRLLAPVLERMFEDVSVGYRAGRSVKTAQAMLSQGVRAGATHALRADIDAFFDQVNWKRLEEEIDRALPIEDKLTRSAIMAAVRTPLQDGEALIARELGILQGSPLSPLLANLFLDRFDEEITSAGHLLIRYADDFVILCDSRDGAEKAQSDVTRILATMELSLDSEKTSIAPIDQGFNFLGMHAPTALDEDLAGGAKHRKALYIKRPYCFIGLDGDSIIVRKDRELIARLPLRRTGEIVFLGEGAVSSKLLRRCAALRIPVSFCSAAGWFSGTFKPDSKAFFQRIAAHSRRHEELGETGRLSVARSIVEAKLRNYRHWFLALPGERARSHANALKTMAGALVDCATIESLRGAEGQAARLTFHALRDLMWHEAFASFGRMPRLKPDRLNAMLDMLYSLLFTRLNVLVRGHGLSPYLGFLHSALDDYESLVCDLQEPFRCRMDRLACKLVNRGEIKPEHFEEVVGATGLDTSPKPKSWKVNQEGVGILIEAFEREEQVKLAGEPSTLGQLLSGQSLAILDWALGERELPAFFVAEVFRKRGSKSQDVQEPP